MSPIELSELLIRGAASGVSVALIAHALFWAGNSYAARLFTITMVTSGIYVIFATPGIDGTLGQWTYYLEAVGVSAVAWMWLATLAVFDDNFRWKHWRLAPPILIGLGNLVFSKFPEIPDIYRTLQLLILVPIIIDTLRTATTNNEDDLVVSRRRLSKAFRTIIPMNVIAVGTITLYEIFQLYESWIRVGVSTLLLGISLSLMIVMSRMDSNLFPQHDNQDKPKPDNLDLTAADRLDLKKIEAEMADGGFLNSRLTITTLAQKLDIPEHRLRKLINRHLGYRNFTAYLNKYRIDEAMRRLADPTLVRTQITSLAFDIGYGSLAPFNRAFKERNGISPTEWREAKLSDDSANDQHLARTA